MDHHPSVGRDVAAPVNPTFKQAALRYIEEGGEARYLGPIIEYFADTPLRSIYPAHVRAMAEALYQNHKGATKNRQAITPARAVILHASDYGWCDRITIKRFKVDKPKRKKPAGPIWLHAFIRQAHKEKKPHAAAIVLFMATTGARVSEAVNLRWEHVDLTGRTALLIKTKTSTNSLRGLTDDMVAMIGRLRTMADEATVRLRQQLEQPGNPDRRIRHINRELARFERVFWYTSRHSVNERIAVICQHADIPPKPPHTCGRHTYANMAMELGLDIVTTMKGGGWESTTVFLETYVRARENSSRIVADRFNVHAFSDL